MDTINASPNRPLRISGFLTAGLGIAVGLWLMGIAAGTAVAQTPPDDTGSEAVSYADLDLSAPAGVQTLLKRIDVASRKVCGKRPMTIRYGQLETYLDCRDTAMSNAVKRINHPTVTLAWAGEAGKAMRVALR